MNKPKAERFKLRPEDRPYLDELQHKKPQLYKAMMLYDGEYPLYDYLSIAIVIDRPVGTVKSRINRARQFILNSRKLSKVVEEYADFQG